jgi:integrase
LEIGTKRLKTLKPEHIEDAFARLAEHGHGDQPTPMSRASLVKIRSVLGKTLAYAERRQLVSRNVARVVELPAAARRSQPGRALTIDQARTLLSSIEGDRLEALWRLMLMLGLRPGEATGLSWPDIDLTGSIVNIRRSLKIHNGQLVITEKLKTTRSRRSLDAPEPVIDGLQAHRHRQIAERRKVGPLWSNPDDLVFTTTVGSPINPANLRRQFGRITESADLGRWHPHELRHSAASLLSAAGVPLEEVADVLGHDGTRMTALVYRHATTPTVKAARVMGDILAE